MPDDPSVTPRTKRVAFNAVLQSAAEVIGKVATLVLTLVAARLLTKEGFGAFSYALSYAPLVAVLWAWGLGTLMIREAADKPDELPRIYGEFVLLRLTLAVPAVAVFGAIGVLLRPDAPSAVVLALVLVAWVVNSFREAGVSAGIARQRVTGVTAAVVTDRLATMAFGIIALLLGTGVVGLGVGFLLGSVAGYVVARSAVRNLGIRLDLRAVDRSRLFPMLRRSFFIGIDEIVSQALFRLDAVMLAGLKGDVALATYAVAYRLLETVLFISWAIARALFPAMSERGGARARKGVEEGIAVLAVLYIPFGVALFFQADRLIPLLFGSDYGSGSAVVARWLAPAPLLFGMSYLAGYGLQALARPKKAFQASLAAAAFNIGGNFVMIPAYGASGAAIMTSAAYALETVISFVMMSRITGWPRLGKGLAAPVAASAAMALAMAFLDIHVLLEIAIGGALYLLLWLPVARATAPQQVDLVISVIPGMKKR